MDVTELVPEVADVEGVGVAALQEGPSRQRGDLLLTLACTPEAVAFRRWYLGEWVAQLQGAPPQPWPEADIEALVRDPILRRATAAESISRPRSRTSRPEGRR